jgi:hypothetical protein
MTSDFTKPMLADVGFRSTATRAAPENIPEAHARGVHNIAWWAIRTRPYWLSGLEIRKSIRLGPESKALPKVRGYLE